MGRLRTRSAGAGPQVIDIPEMPEPASRTGGGAIAQEAISRRAYELWLERGCPEGSPDEDWYKAESELRGRDQATPIAGARSSSGTGRPIPLHGTAMRPSGRKA